MSTLTVQVWFCGGTVYNCYWLCCHPVFGWKHKKAEIVTKNLTSNHNTDVNILWHIDTKSMQLSVLWCHQKLKPFNSLVKYFPTQSLACFFLFFCILPLVLLFHWSVEQCWKIWLNNKEREQKRGAVRWIEMRSDTKWSRHCASTADLCFHTSHR